MRQSWVIEERIKELQNAGKTVYEISKELGINTHDLSLKWTLEENKILEKYSCWEETWLTAYTLSRRYLRGKSEDSIISRRRLLELPAHIIGRDTWRWCREDFERLEKICPSCKDNSYHLREKEDVKKRNPFFEKDYNPDHLSKDKQPCQLTPLRKNRWTQKEERILKQHSKLGETWLTSYTIMKRGYLSKRTWGAIEQRRLKLGLPNCVSNPSQAKETPEEIEQLRLAFPHFNFSKMCNEFIIEHKITISLREIQ